MVLNKYTIINRGIMNIPENEPLEYMKVLKTIHNAGFFSCCSIRLLDIMIYFNDNQGLPDTVDSFEQFAHYKSYAQENLIPKYFKELPIEIPYSRKRELTHAKEEPQFSDYRLIDFADTKPFVDKYFTPSDEVLELARLYEAKYSLDYNNLCAVFFRGNDKNRETKIASHEEFINKAAQVKQVNPNIRFLVQPDEGAFLRAFMNVFQDSIYFTETPYIDNKDSCMVFETPQAQRAEYGAKFYAAVVALSRCKHLITHSGNGSFWATLYRGNCDNMHQWLIDKWID